VTNPKRPLRLNVGFLINGSIGVYRDFEFDYERILVDGDLTLFDFSGMAKVSRTPQGLLVQGNFESAISLECSRCLVEFLKPIKWEFTELYAFTEENITDSGLLVPEDAHIDLEPIIRDYALLEVPMTPLCKEDCKGLCPDCGENLNERDCGHRKDIDSPFAALKNLLD
jgi:uncharacterized protein